MAVIIPFKGLRYNPAYVGDITNVIAPPYDVIDARGQEEYYGKSPYNVIRLELGKQKPEDSENNNRYTRAAAYLKQWLEEGVLIHDDKPSVYLYEQQFEVRGETKVRTGFIAGVKAEDYSKGSVLPHEETLPKHKADRFELMKTTLANFSPIFGLYADPQHNVEKLLLKAKGDRKPDIEVVDYNGVINRLWVIDNPEAVNGVVDEMADKKIFIADGHHRYETAVAFAKEMAARGRVGYDYLMVSLVNLYDKGLVVFPTHRLVHNLKDFDLVKFLENLEQDFYVEILPEDTPLSNFLHQLEVRGMKSHAFGIYAPDKRFYLLQLKNENILDNIETDKSPAWRKLDVSILHTLILEKLLGIGSKQRAEESNLTYTRDEEYAKEAVDSGKYQLAFFMNATKVEEVTDIAVGGEKMPQKSTFFYPKVITGLVMNDYNR